jgi:hypothetical protein
MSDAILVTRDQAILSFLRVVYPEHVAEAEKLVDSLIELGVTGIAEPAESQPKEES